MSTMKVPPLIINLKDIDKGDKHEKHEKHKEHKKHKKHKKHKHKHHHHDHDHSGHHTHNKEHKDKHPRIKILNPPLLEPVGLPEPESHHLFPYQSAYAPPSPVPYPHVLHPVPTPPSQLEQQKDNLEPQTEPQTDGEQLSESQPPILEDKVTSEPADDSKQSFGHVTEPPVTLVEAPNSAESFTLADQQMDTTKQIEIVAGQSGQTISQTNDSAPIDAITEDPNLEIVSKKTHESSSQISYLKLAEDGGVRLNILAPIRQLDDSNEKILNLEQICGQLQEGLDVIPSDINEEECKDQLQVNPVECIDPPTFGSHLPIKDSTFANLTKEDSETLLEIYGGNTTAFEYAESLQNYASGTNYLMKMVDSLLDLLTDGKHNKEAVPIRQRLEEARREEAKKKHETNVIDKPVQNGNSPVIQMEDSNPATGESVSQNDETKMDLDDQENSTLPVKEPDEVQNQLNEIDNLLADLRKIQEQRLSSSPTPVEPDEAETKLADEILEKMTKLIKEKAKPSEICDSSSILKALGIPLDVQ